MKTPLRNLLHLFALLPLTAFGSLTDGLLWQQGFDTAPIKPGYSRGGSEVRGAAVTAVPGPAGQAIQTGKGGLNFAELGNLELQRGTLAMWVRLPSEAESVKFMYFLSTNNFRIRYEPQSKMLFFKVGSNVPGGGFKWDYAVAANVEGKFSDWVHVAITWDREQKLRTLYMNGQKVREARSDLMPGKRNDVNLRFAMGDGKGVGVFLNEAGIWNRVLTEDEIRGLKQTPGNLTKLASALPPPGDKAVTLQTGLYQPGHTASLVAPGEPFKFDVPIFNRGKTPHSGPAKLVLLDFWEKNLASQDVALEIPAGGQMTLAGSFTADARGIYKVALVIEGEKDRDVASFVVWPVGERLSKDSFFGVHANSWNGDVLNQVARLGFTWNRNHNMLQTTWWPRVQPEPGKFVWLHDPSLEANLERGFQVVGQFFGTPYWAAQRGDLKPQRVTASDGPYPYGAVPKMDDYRTYVRETVLRYKDRIRVWETWNEVDIPMFWQGSPEQFAELAKVTYEETKKADPDALVLLGGFSTSHPWIEQAAKAGAFRYADGIGLHLYYSSNAEAMEPFEEQIHRTVDFYNRMMKEHGRSEDMPLWQTEGGSYSTTWLRGVTKEGWPPAEVLPPMDWRSAAWNTIKAETLTQAAGFERSFSYLWNSKPVYADLTEMDVNGAPKPRTVTRAVLARMVDGRRPLEVIARPEGRMRAVVYDGTPALAVVWTAPGGRLQLEPGTLGEALEAKDLMGNPVKDDSVREISVEPRYLFAQMEAPKLVEALRTVPLKVLAEAPELVVKKTEAPVGQPFAAALEAAGKFFQLDLRPVANMAFADDKAGDGKGGWSDEGNVNDMRTMPLGRQTFLGVPFDIIPPESNDGRSVITLRSTRNAPTLPESAGPIPVERRVRNLYFLHSATMASPGGTIGEYVVRYQDGEELKILIVVGKNTGDWWSRPGESEESRVVAVPVEQKSNDRDPGFRFLRVMEWQNPRPDAQIASVEFRSSRSGATPILVAISAVTW